MSFANCRTKTAPATFSDSVPDFEILALNTENRIVYTTTGLIPNHMYQVSYSYATNNVDCTQLDLSFYASSTPIGTQMFQPSGSFIDIMNCAFVYPNVPSGSFTIELEVVASVAGGTFSLDGFRILDLGLINISA